VTCKHLYLGAFNAVAMALCLAPVQAAPLWQRVCSEAGRYPPPSKAAARRCC
jgi:hypothetical protein